MSAQAQSRAVRPAALATHLQLGPVEGLTTDWHPAPLHTGIPVGATVNLRVPVARAAAVRWQGAREVERSSSWSVAELLIAASGDHPVLVTVEDSNGVSFEESCLFEGVDLHPGDVVVGLIEARVAPVEIDPADVNGSTLRHYLADESVAALRLIGPDRYRTSINRWVRLEASVDPPALAPLVEWRLDGEPLRPLGAAVRLRVFVARPFAIEAGPAANPSRLELDTYLVKIVTHRRGDHLAEGVAETFSVVTEPPGLEPEVTWLASTQQGSSDPVLGTGESFTVRFRDTFGIRDLATGGRRQLLGVKADNAIFNQCGERRGVNDFLDIDPDWGFDPETDLGPDPLPGPPRVIPGCDPGLDAVVDPAADANGDGFPDIVALVPAGPGPSGCVEPTRFCREVRPELFEEVLGGPVLHPDVPIPVGAVRQGCAGLSASPVCPVLSGGEQALHCAAIPADPDCLAITLCPEPGGWDDPSDPTRRRIAQSSDQDEPPGSVRLASTDRLEAARLLVINPCDWNRLVKTRRTIGVGSGANPSGLADGEACTANDQCRSRICDQGVCGNPYRVKIEQGTSKWNVSLTAGLERGSATIDSIFHPSLGYDVVTETTFDLHATALGEPLPILDLDARSQVSHCGYEVRFDPRVLGKAPQMVDPTVGIEELDAATPAGEKIRCEERLTALRMAEQKLNEALHNALIAWAYYGLAGPTGTHVTSRDAAQEFLDRYQGAPGRKGAFQDYHDALEAFREAQEAALRQLIARDMAETRLSYEVPEPARPQITVGPFTVGLEIQAVGVLGIEAQITNAARGGLPARECAASDGECFRVDSASSIKPRAAVDLLVFFYAGISSGRFAGVKGGIRGDFLLAELQLPILSEFGLARTTRPLGPPAIPPPFAGLGETLAQPSRAAFSMPFAYGSNLGRGGGSGAAALEARFLDGRLEAVVKAWALFFSGEWSKVLVSWRGIGRSWHLGTAGDGNVAAFLDNVAVGAVPDMVTLPRLELAEAPAAPRSPDQTNALITNALGLGHREGDLLLGWSVGGGTPGKQRCAVPEG